MQIYIMYLYVNKCNVYHIYIYLSIYLNDAYVMSISIHKLRNSRKVYRAWSNKHCHFLIKMKTMPEHCFARASSFLSLDICSRHGGSRNVRSKCTAKIEIYWNASRLTHAFICAQLIRLSDQNCIPQRKTKQQDHHTTRLTR